MNEQELNRILDQEAQASPVLPAEAPRAFRRALNRTLIPRILLTLFLAVLALGGLTWGVSAAMDASCYDPGREDLGLKQEEGFPSPDFAALMESSWSLLFPGETAMVTSSEGQTFRSLGFGRYAIEMKVQPSFDPLAADNVPTHRFSLKWGKLNCTQGQYAYYLNEFRDPEQPELFYENCAVSPEEVRTELKDLPDSARLDVSISFAQSMDEEETAQLLRDFEKANFYWAALEGHHSRTAPQVAGGMPLFRSGMLRGLDESAYPSFTLPGPETVTGEQLRESLQSRLQLLLDHPDFLKAFSQAFSLDQREVSERMELAEQEFRCFGLRGGMGKEDLSRLMESREVTAVTVHDVKLSRFSK